MPFCFAFGIAEEFEAGKRGTCIHVLQNPFASFEEAAQHLADAEPPVVAGRVREAHAYVAEAGTIDEAAALVRTALQGQGASPAVRIVQRDIRTRQALSEPPEIEALSRIHGELCITHQLTKLAVSCATSHEHREQLEHHKAILEDLGYTVRVLRGDDVTEESVGQSGSARLGYSNGQIAGAESATFASSLESLACELSIARYEADKAIQVLIPVQQETLRDLSAALDRFENAVATLQQQARSRE